MARIPDKSEILAWIAENPAETGKRDIARAFGIKGADRVELKRILRQMEAEGHLTRRRRSWREADALPPVSVCEVQGPDAGGDLHARPLEWSGDGVEPRILLVLRRSDPALGAGDRVLLRLQRVEGEAHAYEGRLIRRIGTTAQRMLGVFRASAEGGRILPIDKGDAKEWVVRPGDTHGAKDGELVEAEQAGPKDRLGLPRARIVTRLGDPGAPKAVSLIAIHQHGIPDTFPDDAIAAADAAQPVQLGQRTDLRDLPLVTIDPTDARDHDDAVHAAPDDDPANPGGHVIWVAIADVAHYVPPGGALDREARKRGNSTYFPDRVVPMLPEALSGDLCSLHEGADRACIAVRMVLDARGAKRSHRFHRALMRSRASLTYEDAQSVRDGAPSDPAAPLTAEIGALFDAYDALHEARQARQPLDLDLPERRIELSPEGRVTSVAFRERLDAHRLIEESMVLANVAAAEELSRRKSPLLYRVHEEPSPEKLEALRETAVASGFVLAKGQVLQTRHLNRLLEQAEGGDFAELINMATLRSMTQAYYSPENFGHFGLALRQYAHFTSPIRRYSDLIVHRALIAAHGWGDDGLSPDEIDALDATAKHISETERRSMLAERDTTDRYLAAYLSERVGSEMPGRVSGVQKFGLFVRLDETGADGLVPIGSVGGEYWIYDRDAQTLMGSDSGRVLGVGQRVTVRLAEASPVTGGLIFDLLEVEGAALPRIGRGARGRPVRRAPGRTKPKADKAKRKVKRTRK
ncbi:ribonuclease R [Oceaniovalibus guishaninsula JLT2003]|uniref:Ribonuclease R n=1 Tax=Oceaniovalibus guishaninsula JLT2003 TaxID=1231392 RepID=K2HEP4_9RHOB|nr:ribonuclease R [Oceaniovalibus guishaninsula]EKE44997.1 ribonuclease R [Oceaniovalibus guishaninsula JLT2003]